MQDIVSEISGWEEYRTAIVDTILERGSIPDVGISFSKNGLNWSVSRHGKFEGGRQMHLLVIVVDPEETSQEYSLLIRYTKPGSDNRFNYLNFRGPQSPYIERPNPFNNNLPYREYVYTDYRQEAEEAREFANNFILNNPLH